MCHGGSLWCLCGGSRESLENLIQLLTAHSYVKYDFALCPIAQDTGDTWLDDILLRDGHPVQQKARVLRLGNLAAAKGKIECNALDRQFKPHWCKTCMPRIPAPVE